LRDDVFQRWAVSDAALLTLLGLFVGVPAVAVLVGFDKGSPVFFLYREPKLVAMMILGWLLLASASWILWDRIGWQSLAAVLRLRPLVWLSAFLGYLVLSLAWAVVPENALYELQQYFLLFMLLILLLVWDRIDGRVFRVVQTVMVLSVATVTVIGLFQFGGVLDVLKPIDPSGWVGHPSLMGYKNPMAMAVLGQLFLLAGITVRSSSRRPRRMAVYLGLLLTVELVYLITLMSRSSLFGLAAGLVCLFVLWLGGGNMRYRLVVGLATILFVTATVNLVATVDRQVDLKVESVLEFAVDPASFLESDRGIYLINTFNMAKHNVFGVGVGDWQTHYPVYRAKKRYVWFDEHFQVRRAHSDHVQFLGEGGWVGLFLWTAFLLSLLLHIFRKWSRDKRWFHLFAMAQMIALVAAMATDYVVEHPYGKFQFYLVVFLCLSDGVTTRKPDSRPIAPRGFRIALATLLTVVAAINAVYFVQLARKLVVSAHFTRAYLLAFPSQNAAGQPDQRQRTTTSLVEIQHLLEIAENLDRLPGHTKTMFRDHLLIADALRRIGEARSAEDHLQRSLALHPYHPPSLRLMSELQTDPKVSEEWANAYDYVMHEATVGYRRPYPHSHPLKKPE